MKRTPAVFNQQGMMLQQEPDQTFPLSPHFQEILLRVLFEDRDFSGQVSPHIKPSYFSNPVYQWTWHVAQDYRQKYGTVPTLHWLQSTAMHLPPGQREVSTATLERVSQAPFLDESALKETTLDFLKQALFRQAHLDSRDLYNAGKLKESYAIMRDAMASLDNVSIQRTGRSWLAERFVDRHVERLDGVHERALIGTGFPELDKRFGGGVYPGFLGIWISYPKAGKTTLLMNHGAIAMRLYGKKVFHAVLEGNLKYVEDRYDTLLSGEKYATIRSGNMSPEKYEATFRQYQRLRGLCVVQDYTTNWDTNITAVQADLVELERNHGWRPDLIILDYLDLLKGRKTNYKSPTEDQKDAAQDLKKLANQGYAVWTASQVQRPKDKDAKISQDILYSSSIADCYAKVRIADYVGSINQTLEERRQNIMRLYAELYRDGPADLMMTVNADFSTMSFGVATQLSQAQQQNLQHVPHASRAKDLGYATLSQSKAGGR